MRQLPLFGLRPASVFDTYVVGPNRLAVDLLQAEPSAVSTPIIWLHGPSGTGKTHLLQAVCASAGDAGRAAAYFPLHDLRGTTAEILSGCGDFRWVCLDDIESTLTDDSWERAIFRLYMEFEERGGKLVISASTSPHAVRVRLPDLASRLNAGVVLRLGELTEDERIEALKRRAVRRGFELPEEVTHYLLRRLPRDMNSLCSFIDTLDEASLVAQRRLTLPFVKQVLGDNEKKVDR